MQEPDITVNEKLNELQRTFPFGSAIKEKCIRMRQGDSDIDILSVFFQGKIWSDLDMKKLIKQYKGPISDVPFLMTDLAFSYFFPFFVKSLILAPGICDSLAESLLFRISNGPRDESGLLGDINIDQRDYIMKFLNDYFASSKSYRRDLQAACSYLISIVNA